MNGAINGDWKEEYTFVGVMGCSVTNFVVVNDRLYENVVEFEVGERVDLDHMSIIVEMEDGYENDGLEEGKGEEENR